MIHECFVPPRQSISPLDLGVPYTVTERRPNYRWINQIPHSSLVGFWKIPFGQKVDLELKTTSGKPSVVFNSKSTSWPQGIFPNPLGEVHTWIKSNFSVAGGGGEKKLNILRSGKINSLLETNFPHF